MRKFAVLAGALAAFMTASTVAPAFAVAQDYRYDHDRRVDRRYARSSRSNYSYRCRHDQRSSANKGTVAGALVGGASGALIGGDVLGGLVGAGVGAVAGHAIAKGRTRC